MRYSEISPSLGLRRYVKCYWTLESERLDSAAPEPVMPDGCVEIIFNLSDKFRRYHSDGAVESQPRSIIAGQMRSSAVIEPSGAIDLFGVRFQHAGAKAFFGVPLGELTDKIVDLRFVWGGEGREIEDQIGDAVGVRARVEMIEKRLSKLLETYSSNDGLVEHASEMIAAHSGLVSIEDLAKILGVNGRRLERRFRSDLGLSPKRFSRIVRFQQFLGAVSYGGQEILDAALAFGYYDQAHLIREFKEFSGKTPLAFFENDHKLSEVFINS